MDDSKVTELAKARLPETAAQLINPGLLDKPVVREGGQDAVRQVR